MTSWPSIKQNLCLISMFLNFMLRCINKRPFHHPCQCDVITISYFCYVFHIWTILLFMPTLAYRTTFHTISIFDIKYCGQPVGLPIHVQSHCKHCDTQHGWQWAHHVRVSDVTNCCHPARHSVVIAGYLLSLITRYIQWAGPTSHLLVNYKHLF